ncbi:MAG TPA: lactate racemase domain-containing protein [Kofleriaceae bacterium]|nr:lactate racemase domain-containing protein [Kofleriaceae bacterium]
MRALPFGRASYPLDLGDRPAIWVEPRALPDPPPLERLLGDALDAPIASPRLEQLAPPGSRVTLIVSDATRDEPRARFVAMVMARCPDVRWTLAIATGTHGRSGVTGLGLPDAVLAGATIVDHDGHDERDLQLLGITSRGTPMRIHRCVLDADLILATGCIRPHYFAGFGAGAKAIFPGLGHAPAIRINHRWKQAPGARAGILDGNPCREDIEEAVALVPTPTFLLNGVCGPDGQIHAVVAGDLRRAFRAGAELARPWFTVTAPRSRVVIASDVLPVTSTLYQAAKIAAAAAPLVDDQGVLVLAAECPDGTGPLDTVNEAIFRIGVLPRLPASARIVLVSSLSEATVRTTLVDYAPSIEAVLLPDRPSPVRDGSPIVVLPRASQLLVEPTP